MYVFRILHIVSAFSDILLSNKGRRNIYITAPIEHDDKRLKEWNALILSVLIVILPSNLASQGSLIEMYQQKMVNSVCSKKKYVTHYMYKHTKTLTLWWIFPLKNKSVNGIYMFMHA